MKKHLTTLVLSIVSLLYSCRKDETNSPQLSSVNTAYNSLQIQGSDSIVLGQKLPNPYTVEAFDSAKHNLVMAGLINPEAFIVRATHKYVRIYIETDEEEFAATEDSSVVAFDFPLDYEIIQDGSYFIDQSLADSTKYIYMVVPVGFDFPYPIKHKVETLAEIVLNEAGENQFYDLIEEESFKIKELWTAEDFGSDSSGKLLGGTYRPGGTIT